MSQPINRFSYIISTKEGKINNSIDTINENAKKLTSNLRSNS